MTPNTVVVFLNPPMSCVKSSIVVPLILILKVTLLVQSKITLPLQTRFRVLSIKCFVLLNLTLKQILFSNVIFGLNVNYFWFISIDCILPS